MAALIKYENYRAPLVKNIVAQAGCLAFKILSAYPKKADS